MFSAASSTIVTMPPMMSPGLCEQCGEERAQVVRHEERRDRDRDDVVEPQRPAREERDDVVEGVARERRGAARFGEHRGALGVGLGRQREQAAGEQEHQRREAERVRGDETERVVDRGADVAVGGGEQAGHADRPAQPVLAEARHAPATLGTRAIKIRIEETRPRVHDFIKIARARRSGAEAVADPGVGADEGARGAGLALELARAGWRCACAAAAWRRRTPAPRPRRSSWRWVISRPRLTREHAQQRELDRRQVHLLAVEPHGVRREVDQQAVGLDARLG